MYKYKKGVKDSLNTTEACGQFHDSSEGITSGYRCGQIRHQKAFQHVQDFIFSHLKNTDKR